jgi:hypothetical protein
MALQTSGTISLDQIHVEVGGSSGSAVTVNDSDVRGLVDKSSGATMSFNEWYGASNLPPPFFNYIQYAGTGNTGANQAITTGLNMSGDGGLVMISGLTDQDGSWFFDTTRGAGQGIHPTRLSSNYNAPNPSNGGNWTINDMHSFTTTGFTVQGTSTQINSWPYNNEGNGFDNQATSFKTTSEVFGMTSWNGNSDVNTPSLNTTTVSHSLGVVPEMMWIKDYGGGFGHWICYHKDMASGTGIPMSSGGSTGGVGTSYAGESGRTFFNGAPTSTQVKLGTSGYTNRNTGSYIAYLFASKTDVAKVGSYTGNGSSQTIDCDFSTGAQYVLIKDLTTYGGKWIEYRRSDGFVSGNERKIYFSQHINDVTNLDEVDPHNSGFIVNTSSVDSINVSGRTYMFYAVAVNNT